MTSNRGPSELAAEWKEAWNSHDLDRILSLYSEDVIFKSPRIRTVSGEESGVLRGKPSVRDYLRRIFERRPDLNCTVGYVFAGVDRRLIALSQVRPHLATPPRSKPDFGPRFGRWPSRLGAFRWLFFDAVGHA